MRKLNTISKILKLKDNKKQEVELEVREASDRLDDERDKLLGMENEYQQKLESFNRKNSDGSLDINNITSYYDYFARIEGRVKKQKEHFAVRKKELDVAKDNLINAHKDQKVFEILKDKAVKSDQKEKAESAQKEADYFILTRKLR